MEPAAACDAQTLGVFEDVVSPGSLAVDVQSYVFVAPTPAVFEPVVVFDSPLAVSRGHTDVAFAGLVVEIVQHVVCCAADALEALLAEFGALDSIKGQRIDAV